MERSEAILAQVVVCDPRRLEPKWNHVRLKWLRFGGLHTVASAYSVRGQVASSCMKTPTSADKSVEGLLSFGPRRWTSQCRRSWKLNVTTSSRSLKEIQFHDKIVHQSERRSSARDSPSRIEGALAWLAGDTAPSNYTAPSQPALATAQKSQRRLRHRHFLLNLRLLGSSRSPCCKLKLCAVSNPLQWPSPTSCIDKVTNVLTVQVVQVPQAKQAKIRRGGRATSCCLPGASSSRDFLVSRRARRFGP